MRGGFIARLGSLGSARGALEAVRASLDLQPLDERIRAAIAQVERSREELRALLASLPGSSPFHGIERGVHQGEDPLTQAIQSIRPMSLEQVMEALQVDRETAHRIAGPIEMEPEAPAWVSPVTDPMSTGSLAAVRDVIMPLGDPGPAPRLTYPAGCYVHHAGPELEGLQTCTRCGITISDNRNVAYLEADGPPRGFPEGPVTVHPGNPRVTETGARDGVPLCGGLPS